jgi:hypothetical protein
MFDEPHPSREAPKKQNLLAEQMFLSCDIENLTIIGIFQTRLICSNSNSLYLLSIQPKSIHKPEIQQWKSKITGAVQVVPMSVNSAAAFLRNGHLSIVHRKSPAHDVVCRDLDNVTCLSASRQLICVGRGDTSITVVRCGQVQSFPSFRDKILCSACSSAFDLVVVGARPGSLFLISPSRQSITRVISLDDLDPILVEITKGWGFIVVYEVGRQSEGQSLEVFTVNGDLILKKNIPFQIECWSACCSPDGFDYLVISPVRGRLMTAEVFTLSFSSCLSKALYGIKSAFYSPQLEIAFCGQSDGRIMALPWDLDK